MLGVNKFGPDGQLDMAIYRRGAEDWHTDGAYDEEPFKATQLYALAVPSRGGDTFFASMYAAYDGLPQRLKDRLEGRRGAFTYGGRRKATALLNRRTVTGSRSSIRSSARIPRPGARALLRSGQDPAHRGLEAAESDALIEELTGA
jgi:alpha-ketoglutarate-dependent taurine dioxygenase